MCDHWDLWWVQVDGKAGAYEWLTYRQVADLVDKVASGLVSTGLQAKDKVAVYGSNSPEWMIAMQVRLSSSVLTSTSRTLTAVVLPWSVY